MLRRKTQEKRKRRPSWGWLTALVGLAALFIALWRAMVKRAGEEREQTLPAGSKPEGEKGEPTRPVAPKATAEEGENTQEKASPLAGEMVSSEEEVEPPSG